VDIFSAGIILHILLTGIAPFYGISLKEIMEKNIKCILLFNEHQWNSVSKEGKELCILMTKINPNQRITAKMALDHPWFANEENCELNDALETLSKYKFEPKMTLSKMKEEEKIMTRTPLMKGNYCEPEDDPAFSGRNMEGNRKFSFQIPLKLLSPKNNSPPLNTKNFLFSPSPSQQKNSINLKFSDISIQNDCKSCMENSININTKKLILTQSESKISFIKKQIPSEFKVTFHYPLEEGSECNPGVNKVKHVSINDNTIRKLEKKEKK